MVEQLFSHLLKVVNICAHVLDEVAPGPAAKVTAAPRLPRVPAPPASWAVHERRRSCRAADPARHAPSGRQPSARPQLPPLPLSGRRRAVSPGARLSQEARVWSWLVPTLAPS